MRPSRPRLSSTSVVQALGAIALAAAVSACAAGEEAIDPIPLREPYQELSRYGFFEGALADLSPAAGVSPYEVVASLWSDNARKDRFIALPEGAHAELTPEEDWVFPDGAAVIKTFSFPEDLRAPDGPKRIVETRVLLRAAGAWTAHVYLWNDAQTEATRVVAGKRVEVAYTDESGAAQRHEYVVPNTNQCGNCHARNKKMHLLGAVTRQVNHPVRRDGVEVEQLAWLADRGVFPSPAPTPAQLSTPMVAPFGTASVAARARSYLHANCAHCHRADGGAGSTGLVLLAWETKPYNLGACKTTVAAGSGTGGHTFDVVPGNADDSILPFRMGQLDPEIKMPVLANRIPDAAGIELVKSWIQAMPPNDCSAAKN